MIGGMNKQIGWESKVAKERSGEVIPFVYGIAFFFLTLLAPSFAFALITTASPAGGVYASAQNVTLHAYEPASITATIYYTTDGTTPTTSSAVYSGAIHITATTTLKFFAVDTAGNVEPVRTKNYAIIQSGWVSITAGVGHTVAVKSDGTLWAWGYNGAGQLGDGTTTDKYTPEQIGSDNKWVAIAAGDFHTVAVKSDGTLWAWGYNGDGQLGDGTTTNKNIPEQVGSDNKWVSVAGGGSHTVAVKSDGTLWAWGYNGDGQLGDGTTTNKNIPEQVGSDNKWVYVAAGADHTVAVKSDGTLWAWGYNGDGELGDGTTTNKNIPEQVGSDNKWVSVACGDFFTIALKSDGTLWNWGSNDYGQLGDGTTTNKNIPEQVGSDNKWVSAAGNDCHTLALKWDGTLWALGRDDFGQLGDGAITNNTVAPVQTGSDTNWISIAAGYINSVALKSDGTLWAWGSNGDELDSDWGITGGGSLGDGSSLHEVEQSPEQISGALPYTVYTVTPSATSGGTISPNAAQTVNSGALISFSVWPNSGYTASVGGTCGFTSYGWIYTTNAITANCTVLATFTPTSSSCIYSINSAGQSFGSSGGAGSVSVTASSGCAWTATSNASWITITSGSSGAGSGTVSYSVAANTSTSALTGTMTIAGQTFTVTQSGAPTNGACGSSNGANLTAAPTANLCSTGSASAVSGTGPWTWSCNGTNGGTIAGCSANLQTNGACGSSNGANLTAAPTANLCSTGSASAVSGTGPWTWSCNGANNGTNAGCSANICTYSISPTSQSFSSTGGIGNVTVTPSSSACSWTATSNNSPWLTIMSGSNGTGIGTVTYSVSTSTNSQTGTMTIGGQTFTVTQNAGPYTLTVSETGTGSGTVTANSGTIRWNGSTGTATYNGGTSVTLTAAASSGSTFTSWTGCDSASGSTCTVSMTGTKNVTAVFTAVTQCPTSLTIDAITPTIISTQNPNITISGTLTDGCSGNSVSLSGLPITLTFLYSDGTTIVSPASFNTNTASGGYTYYGNPNLPKNGTYTVTAGFAGNATLGLAAGTSGSKTVQMGSSVGYAVIIEGSNNGTGDASHNKTTSRIYNMLKARGFLTQNIYYFNYTSGTGVDAAPTKAAIAAVISGSDGSFNLSSKLKASPAPTYIFMVDHGADNIFYLDSTNFISPSDLNVWLTALESSLAGSPALNEKRVVVIGACYSGSFIPTLSGSGRIVITSATGSEVSAQGTMEPDGVRSGEFFVEELVKEMGQGQTIKAAFQAAAASTGYYTQWSTMSSAPFNNTFAFADNTIQHPLLYDNNDSGPGSNDLTLYNGEGPVSNNVTVGTNPTAQSPGASIVSVTPTEFLSGSATTQNLWAQINNTDSNTPLVWIEVRDPGNQITTSANTTDPTEQLEVPVTYKQMTQVSGTAQWQYSQYNFSDSGKYEVYYYAEDPSTNVVTPMQRSVVYKNKSGNNPPNAFALTSPLGGTQTSVVAFNWNAAADPDGDNVTYTIEIASDSTFNPSGAFYFKQEELTVNAFTADSSVKLQDGSTYYWKVTAIDSYGARTVCSNNYVSFTVSNSTNAGLPQFVSGKVTDSVTGQPISSFTVQVSNGGTISSIPGTGYYLISSLSIGNYTLIFNAANYTQYSASINLTTPGGTYPLDIQMQGSGSAAQSCAYSLSAGTQVLGASSGTEAVNVTADPTGCTGTWSATASDSWITITSGSSGTASGTVSYSVTANTGTSSRTGSLTIGGQTLTVTQAGHTTCANLPVMIAGSTPAYYSTLQSACTAACSGDTIQSQAGSFTENLDFNSNVSVTLQGGYDSCYSTDSSYSTISGTLTITNGTVNVQNITIQ